MVRIGCDCLHPIILSLSSFIRHTDLFFYPLAVVYYQCLKKGNSHVLPNFYEKDVAEAGVDLVGHKTPS